MSRESLKSINGGAQTVPVDMCPAPKKLVRCVDPDHGAVTWQCTVNGDPGLCVRVIEI